MPQTRILVTGRVNDVTARKVVGPPLKEKYEFGSMFFVPPPLSFDQSRMLSQSAPLGHLPSVVHIVVESCICLHAGCSMCARSRAIQKKVMLVASVVLTNPSVVSFCTRFQG